MEMKEAIQKAIEGGWGKATDYRPKLRSYFDAVSYYGRNWPGYFLDPLFWQCLGKALGWSGIVDITYTNAFGSTVKEFSKPRWVFHWHRFIDHLAENKDVDSFFRDLLPPNHKPNE